MTMSCESFRARFRAGTEDPEVLAHLRICDRCLDHAATVDPDAMFRALGGEDLVPPGGVDAFVDGVMQQVRVRGAEKTVVRRPPSQWLGRLAIAASLAVASTGALLVHRAVNPGSVGPVPLSVERSSAVTRQAGFATKPVVETYQGENATIVEVPAEAADDVQIVMIFDESLPADL